MTKNYVRVIEMKSKSRKVIDFLKCSLVAYPRQERATKRRDIQPLGSNTMPSVKVQNRMIQVEAIYYESCSIHKVKNPLSRNLEGASGFTHWG